jgi:acetyltransferase-like isoleucine patch superfamily enzyme
MKNKKGLRYQKREEYSCHVVVVFSPILHHLDYRNHCYFQLLLPLILRNCTFGNGTRIGFNCEIGKSYFAGNDKISHQNVILDSIIGEKVWFGGYSGTANVLLNQGCIRYETSSGNLVNTGTNHFGALVGNNCAIGASVIILPGRRVPKDTMIPPGTIFGSKKNTIV